MFIKKHKQLKRAKPKNFKCLIGGNEETFEAMIDEFKTYEINRKKDYGIGGRKSLYPEDKVLLMFS
jgi:hypothetical protein